jgi:hypothetical protein
MLFSAWFPLFVKKYGCFFLRQWRWGKKYGCLYSCKMNLGLCWYYFVSDHSISATLLQKLLLWISDSRGLDIWCIVGSSLVPLAKSQHGKFYARNCYIILNVSISPPIVLTRCDVKLCTSYSIYSAWFHAFCNFSDNWAENRGSPPWRPLLGWGGGERGVISALLHPHSTMVPQIMIIAWMWLFCLWLRLCPLLCILWLWSPRKIVSWPQTRLLSWMRYWAPTRSSTGKHRVKNLTSSCRTSDRALSRYTPTPLHTWKDPGVNPARQRCLGVKESMLLVSLK